MFHNAQLKRQIEDIRGRINRNKIRLETILKFKTDASLEAQQMKSRIKLDTDEADRLERKLKRGGF